MFIFKEVPAQERSATEVYLSEVDDCDLYLGLHGESYGNVDRKGISATEREYDRAMYMRGYIEHVGSGTGDIIERCRAKGLPPPIWENEDDGCVLTIRRPTVPGQGKNVHDSLRGTDQVSDQVSDQVVSLVCACGDGWHSAAALRSAVAITHLHFFRMKYLRPAVDLGLVEMSQPESPRAPTQKYRLTDKGRSLAAQLSKKKGGAK